MGLTEREKEILRFIERQLKVEERAPTLQEIGQRLDVYPSTVHEHLTNMEKKGYISREPHKWRSIEIIEPLTLPELTPVPVIRDHGENSMEREEKKVLLFPVHFFDDPRKVTISDYFLFQVSDDLMGDVGLHPEDYVLVRRTCYTETDDIVVVRYQGKTLIRRWKEKLSVDSQILLVPENIEKETIPVKKTDIEVLGQVVGAIRTFSNLDASKQWIERERHRLEAEIEEKDFSYRRRKREFTKRVEALAEDEASKDKILEMCAQYL